MKIRKAFVPPERADIHLRGSIERRDDEWVVTLVVTAADRSWRGTRELRRKGSQCYSMNQPLALVLALLLDMPGDEMQKELAGSPGGTGGWEVRFDAAMRFSYGVMPEYTIGPSLGLGVEPPGSWPIWLYATYWLPARSIIQDGMGGRFTSGQAALGVCPPILHDSRWWIHLCFGGQIGAIHGEGIGLDPPNSETRLLAQIDSMVVLSWRMAPPLLLRIGIGSAFSLARPRFFFELDDRDQLLVHKPDLITPAARIGLGI